MSRGETIIYMSDSTFNTYSELAKGFGKKDQAYTEKFGFINKMMKFRPSREENHAFSLHLAKFYSVLTIVQMVLGFISFFTYISFREGLELPLMDFLTANYGMSSYILLVISIALMYLSKSKDSLLMAVIGWILMLFPITVLLFESFNNAMTSYLILSSLVAMEMVFWVNAMFAFFTALTHSDSTRLPFLIAEAVIALLFITPLILVSTLASLILVFFIIIYLIITILFTAYNNQLLKLDYLEKHQSDNKKSEWGLVFQSLSNSYVNIINFFVDIVLIVIKPRNNQGKE